MVWFWVAFFAFFLVLLGVLARYNLWRMPVAWHAPRILMYHRIVAADQHGKGEGIRTTPEQFAWQMAWLARRGVQFVTVSQLLAATNCTKLVAITFDDGYADNFTTAWPILKQFQAPATIYLAPNMPDIERLTPAMIQVMSAAGIEFGAHTMNHVHLPSTDDATAMREMLLSKQAVEALTGLPCLSFAYPYGKFFDRHVAMVQAAAFASAVTTKKRILPCAAFDVLRLPRLSMVGQMNRFEFWLTITRGRFRV
ncbi:MAG: polysaccharide deacetylase family protein [Halothiobacillaceae bacterium]|nr:polysaccharide deacetylase family protein [Halothiobacillaceae bacterium]